MSLLKHLYGSCPICGSVNIDSCGCEATREDYEKVLQDMADKFNIQDSIPNIPIPVNIQDGLITPDKLYNDDASNIPKVNESWYVPQHLTRDSGNLKINTVTPDDDLELASPMNLNHNGYIKMSWSKNNGYINKPSYEIDMLLLHLSKIGEIVDKNGIKIGGINNIKTTPDGKMKIVLEDQQIFKVRVINKRSE